ncbi:MAG: hypothetical protein AAGK78_02735, partial [Planctomycetota bacterium]
VGVRSDYTSANLLGELLDDGQLDFVYRDDAVISFAGLTLTLVPEPALGGLALFALPLLLRRR